MCVTGDKKSRQGKYECSYPSCDHLNNQRTLLAQHYISTHLNKPFICNVCGKRFVYSKTLKKHQRSHKGDSKGNVSTSKAKSYVCDTCDEVIDSETEYKIHISQCPEDDESKPTDVIKSEPKPKRRRSVNDVKKDEKITSPESQVILRHTCSECDKSFQSREQLVLHVITCNVSSDACDRKCPICSLRFQKERLYRVHILNYHNDLFNLMFTN